MRTIRIISRDYLPLRYYCRLVGLALVGTCCIPAFAQAGIVRVGTGCQATTIQQGIDIAQAQAGTDTLQINRHQGFFEHVLIDGNVSPDLIILQGGHDGCSDSRSGRSLLLFSSADSATLRMENGARVVLSEMQVGNPGNTAIRCFDCELTLEGALVTGSGLGISIAQGASLLVDASSQITENHHGFNGGGIACNTTGISDSQIVVRGLIERNSGSSGGGIYATSGCEIVLAGARFRGNAATGAGGGIHLRQGANLAILAAPNRNEFRDGEANLGGAIYATGTGTTIELDDVDLHDNQASLGGSIYVQANAQVTLMGGVEIFDNEATYDGGGVAAYSSSVISLRDGVRVRNNTAEDGGGFYLGSNSRLSGSANGPLGIEITENSADYGGGLFLENPGTSAILYNYIVRGNRAQYGGGGVAVRYDAFLEMNRGNSIPCANPPRCSVLSSNVLTQGADGSALFVDTGASAKLYQTYIELNRHEVHAAPSRVVQTRHVDTNLRLEGIQFWKNDATYLIGADASSVIQAGFITAARNAWTVDADTELPVLGATVTNGGHLTLASSILVDTRGYSGNIANDCLIIDDDSGLVTSLTIAVGVDPRLADPDSGDLHLLAGSLAIDYCDTTVFAPEDPLDLDLEARGADHPEVPMIRGLYDIGFDETLASSLIFADGFESGNTSAW